MERERECYIPFCCPDHNHFKVHPSSIEYKSARHQLTAGDFFVGVIAICPDHAMTAMDICQRFSLYSLAV